MGRKVAPRQPWPDERSVTLLKQIVSGKASNDLASFEANPTLYDIPLIAIWGFYRAQSAGSDREALRQAIEIMELAAPHFSPPQLLSALADARKRLATTP